MMGDSAYGGPGLHTFSGFPDRSSASLLAPIGPSPIGSVGRAPPNLMSPPGAPGAPGSTPTQSRSLLPDQEFIPINTDSPSLDRMQVFGDSPFASSLFSSPFAMFGPVTSYGGENAAGASGSGLLADLHADSQPVENATGRHKSESG